MSKLNKFFGDIWVSPLMDQLAEYNVSGQTIGHGSSIGTKVITSNAPVGSVTDWVIQAQLKKLGFVKDDRKEHREHALFHLS